MKEGKIDKTDLIIKWTVALFIYLFYFYFW
ncbi:MAG: hypothetical protein KatS3mg002_1006 [Candidatus Woesearchaeota archaeon]|nr:MAG: hypothetical protein KatS3mg002_1006 [Candidatus Woesearchaeota archaeon]